MTKILTFEKPQGMRDWSPYFWRKKETVTEEWKKVMKEWGYECIQTPTLEYFDTVGVASNIENTHLFKLLDREGNTLILRPDMTSPIARYVTSSLSHIQEPLRLAYHAPIFRSTKEGRPREFEQVGIELIGDGSVYATAEVITILGQLFQRTYEGDWMLTIGHAGLLQALMTKYVENEEWRQALLKEIYSCNVARFKELVLHYPLSIESKEMLLDLLRCKGGKEFFEQLKKLEDHDVSMFIEEIKELHRLLSLYGLQEMIQYDMLFLPEMNYYTGIQFELHVQGVGVPVASGGRYDRLYSKFGKECSAVGFAVHLDLIMDALPSQKREKDTMLILFEEEYYVQAIALCKRLRGQGNKVVLQVIGSVTNKEEYEERYKLTFYVGKEEAGVADI